MVLVEKQKAVYNLSWDAGFPISTQTVASGGKRLIRESKKQGIAELIQRNQDVLEVPEEELEECFEGVHGIQTYTYTFSMSSSVSADSTFAFLVPPSVIFAALCAIAPAV